MSSGTSAPTLLSEAEASIAKKTSRVLASNMDGEEPVQLRVIGSSARDTIQLPASAVRMLIRILDEMARGNTVALLPVHAELTTQEAANLLNISRPSLILLLDQGEIEYRRVGRHRRVKSEALMAYKRRVDVQRRAVLAELAAYDQELGI